jgi:hypothetical protein
LRQNVKIGRQIVFLEEEAKTFIKDKNQAERLSWTEKLGHERNLKPSEIFPHGATRRVGMIEVRNSKAELISRPSRTISALSLLSCPPFLSPDRVPAGDVYSWLSVGHTSRCVCGLSRGLSDVRNRFLPQVHVLLRACASE